MIKAKNHTKILMILQDNNYDSANLQCIGTGKEGETFETEKMLFKYFPDKAIIPETTLNFIKEHILGNQKIQCLREITEILETETELVFVSPNKHCSPYKGGDENGTLQILEDAYRNGYVHTNFKPDNLMYAERKILKLIDVGRDVVPLTDSLFKNMVERAFLTTYYSDSPNLTKMVSALHTENRRIDEMQLRNYSKKLLFILGVNAYE